jgi:hypothetical protein
MVVINFDTVLYVRDKGECACHRGPTIRYCAQCNGEMQAPHITAVCNDGLRRPLCMPCFEAVRTLGALAV